MPAAVRLALRLSLLVLAIMIGCIVANEHSVPAHASPNMVACSYPGAPDCNMGGGSSMGCCGSSMPSSGCCGSTLPPTTCLNALLCGSQAGLGGCAYGQIFVGGICTAPGQSSSGSACIGSLNTLLSNGCVSSSSSTPALGSNLPPQTAGTVCVNALASGCTVGSSSGANNAIPVINPVGPAQVQQGPSCTYGGNAPPNSQCGTCPDGFNTYAPVQSSLCPPGTSCNFGGMVYGASSSCFSCPDHVSTAASAGACPQGTPCSAGIAYAPNTCTQCPGPPANGTAPSQSQCPPPTTCPDGSSHWPPYDPCPAAPTGSTTPPVCTSGWQGDPSNPSTGCYCAATGLVIYPPGDSCAGSQAGPPDCSTSLPANAAQGCLCHTDFITHHPPGDPCPGVGIPAPAGSPPACTSGWQGDPSNPGTGCYCAANGLVIYPPGDSCAGSQAGPPDCSSTSLPANAAQGCLCHTDFITHHPPGDPCLGVGIPAPAGSPPACTSGWQGDPSNPSTGCYCAATGLVIYPPGDSCAGSQAGPPDCSSTSPPANAAQGCLCHTDFITHHPPGDPCPGVGIPAPAGSPPACTSGWQGDPSNPSTGCYCAANGLVIYPPGDSCAGSQAGPPDCSSTSPPANAAQGCLCHTDFTTHHPPNDPCPGMPQTFVGGDASDSSDRPAQSVDLALDVTPVAACQTSGCSRD